MIVYSLMAHPQRSPSSVNVPWPSAGMGDADYLLAFQKIIMPIAMEFAPELVISKRCEVFFYNGVWPLIFLPF